MVSGVGYVFLSLRTGEPRLIYAKKKYKQTCGVVGGYKCVLQG
jgi:hypothetical protein